MTKETNESAPAGRPALTALRQEMDRMFDELFSAAPLTPLRRRQLEADPWRRLQSVFDATTPVVDVMERDKDYRIIAELPGLVEKDLDIALAGNVLTIKGEKKQEAKEATAEYVVSERRYGAFQRSFPLPEDADAEQIDAGLKDGVLTITVPKRADAARQQRKIDVKVR